MQNVSGIRVFRASRMKYTFFESDLPPEPLARIGLRYVGSPAEADIILGETIPQLQKFGTLEKRFAIWTNEPRYDLTYLPLAEMPKIARPVHVMNVHTGTLNLDNYFFLTHPKYIDLDRDQVMRGFAAKPRRVVMLATFRAGRHWLRWYFSKSGRRRRLPASLAPLPRGGLMREGENLDLRAFRQGLAIDLYRQGLCDIFGHDWPQGIRVGGEDRMATDWRDADWRGEKHAVLGNYRINLALENTIAPHYVTEKIWDAICGACLPVYHGRGNRIYDDFPAGSFIDTDGKTRQAVAEEIKTIDAGEASDRFEACLDTYLRIVRERRPKESGRAALERTAAFIQGIMDAGS
jgi:hypothetical protein